MNCHQNFYLVLCGSVSSLIKVFLEEMPSHELCLTTSLISKFNLYGQKYTVRRREVHWLA